MKKIKAYFKRACKSILSFMLMIVIPGSLIAWVLWNLPRIIEWVSKMIKAVKNVNTTGSPGGLTRSERNKNPGNIGQNKFTYDGEVKPSQDDRFKQFETDIYGYAGIYRLLKAYILQGYNTVESIMKRWAPPSDGNDTEAYIKWVLKKTTIPSRTTILSLEKNNPGTKFFNDYATQFATAISEKERGKKANQTDVVKGFQYWLNNV